MLLVLFVLALVFFRQSLSIKFGYTAEKHQFICFNQDIQKQTRYQVIVKSDTPTFSLQLLEQQNSVYQDSRAQAYIKQYSAFAKQNGILMICLANLDFQQPKKYQIQFYHGSHLQPLDSDSFSQLEQIYSQSYQMQKFVQGAYDMNVKTLLDRNKIVGSLQFVATIATILFFVFLGISRIILVVRLKKMMRAKKLI